MATKKVAIKSKGVGSFAFANAGLSDEQAKSILEALKKAIKEIQSGNASKLRFEELYRNSYTLVLHKHGDMLYNGVSECVKAKLLEISDIVVSAQSDQLLDVIVEQWERHKLTMGMIRDILMYMDKTYCKNAKKVLVYDMGLLLFRDHVIRHSSVAGRLKKLLLENVQKERNGEVINRILMKNCLSMLVEVNVTSTEVYQDEFEKDFLDQTRNFYKQESQEFMAQNTIPDYLRKIEERLNQEEGRADNYLDKSTKSKVRGVVQEELVINYAQRLVEDEKTGCVTMFNRAMTEDLGRMYQLFSREPDTLNYLRESMSKLVREIGSNIVKDKENLKNPTQFVQQVLDTRTKFNQIVTESFKSDRTFVRALKEALEYFINLDSRAAQYLSLYIDDMLRKGKVPPAEIEQRLNNVISIFRYLQDKDVFEDFYKKHLAARLLTNQTKDQDVEKKMIAELKTECGHQYTSRLEGMFKDIEISKQLMKGFKSGKRLEGIDLQVTVLTTGFWPIPVVPICVLPTIASDCTDEFTRYYTHLHSGRRLTWQTNLGTAEVRAVFEKAPKDLSLHTYQMCIMLLFTSRDELSYAEIKKETGIPEAELERHLLSLAHPKVRVLRKEPNNKSLQDDHKFAYNEKYTSPMRRVKIPLLSAKAMADPAKKEDVPDGVMEARKNRVEAAIVRVMKARKTLEHNNLIAEVVKQLQARFAVEPAFIKKRIESLIDREYLERDKEDRKLYHYLA